MAKMEKDISYIKEGMVKNDADHVAIKESIEKNIEEIRKLLEKTDEKFVTKIEFGPVRSIVYSMVGFILLAVLGAVISFFVLNY